MTGAQAHPEFTPPDASVIEADVAAALGEDIAPGLVHALRATLTP